MGKLFLKAIAFILVILSLFLFAGAQASSSPNTITLVNPKFGYAKVSKFDLTVSTSNSSVCKFTTNPLLNYSDIDSPNNLFTTADGYLHVRKNFILEVPDNFLTKFYAKCRTDTGYINDNSSFNMTLSIDTTPPAILSAYSEPDFVIERLETSLIAETDDETICRFDQSNFISASEYAAFFENANITKFSKKNILVLSKYTVPALEDKKSYRFYASCMNRAGYFSELKVIDFSIDLTNPSRITQTFPSGVFFASRTNVTVVTNRDSDCYFGEKYVNKFPQEQSKVHFIEIPSLTESSYSYDVQCVFGDGIVTKKNINFTIDKTPPSAVIIETDKERCANNSLNAYFHSTDNTLVASYKYRILDSKKNIIVNYTTNSYPNETIFGLNLTRGESYFWEVSAFDIAKNPGLVSSSTGTFVLGERDERCRPNNAPYINITNKTQESSIKVMLGCIDDDGSCKKTQYYLVNSLTNSSCRLCGKCPYYNYSSSLTISENTTVCYKLTDDLNKTTESSINLVFKTCTNKNDNCCIDKEDNVCDLDCGFFGTSFPQDPDCTADKIDTDMDLMPDFWEMKYFLDKNLNNAGLDSDNDSLTNMEEFRKQTDPTRSDTDSDGFSDKEEIDSGFDPTDHESHPIDENQDSDKDGISDLKEKNCNLNPDDPKDAQKDNDKDGLSNKEECVRHKTNLNKEDSDGDGFSDKAEIDALTSPIDEEEFPKSHILNIIFFLVGLASLSSGAVLFIKSPKQKTDELKISKKAEDLVNFDRQEKEMGNEFQAQELVTMQKNSFKKKQAASGKIEEDIDSEIRKRKSLSKIRNMTTIFDEFAKDEKPEKKEVLQKENTYNAKLYERLKEISNKDSFEEIEKISKKEELKKTGEIKELNKINKRGKK